MIRQTIRGYNYHVIRLCSEFIRKWCLLDLRITLRASHSRNNRTPVLRLYLIHIIDLAFIVHILHIALICGQLSYSTVDVPVKSAVTNIHTKPFAFLVNSQCTKGRLHISRCLVKGAAFFDLSVDRHKHLFKIGI